MNFRFGQILECQRCYILVITQALGTHALPDIYALALVHALGRRMCTIWQSTLACVITYRIRKKFQMGKASELKNIQRESFVVNPFTTNDMSCTLIVLEEKFCK